MRIESNLYLPSTKAIWYLGIIFPNNDFNLLANTFAKILYIQLTKLIRWKYLILLTPIFFSIRVLALRGFPMLFLLYCKYICQKFIRMIEQTISMRISYTSKSRFLWCLSFSIERFFKTVKRHELPGKNLKNPSFSTIPQNLGNMP